MKKHLVACVFAGLLLSGCNNSTEHQETTITETETVAIDTVGVEMDNTRVEIEQAAADVDSLLNEL